MMSIDKNQVLNTALKFHHSGDLDKADELYLKVIKHDKNDFNANHLHGCILSAKNRHHDAITFLLIALKIKPTNYEVNNNLIDTLTTNGLSVAGKSVDKMLVEVIEIKDHPWFIGCQFHPEFTSDPRKGHPLFSGFIKAAKTYKIRK